MKKLTVADMGPKDCYKVRFPYDATFSDDYIYRGDGREFWNIDSWDKSMSRKPWPPHIEVELCEDPSEDADMRSTLTVADLDHEDCFWVYLNNGTLSVNLHKGHGELFWNDGVWCRLGMTFEPERAVRLAYDPNVAIEGEDEKEEHLTGMLTRLYAAFKRLSPIKKRKNL